MINKEFSVFLAFILIGLIIGFLFDFFRILRRIYKTPDCITILEDIAFWIFSGIILLSGIFILNEGKIRAFLFIGLFSGIILYIITISKYFIKIGITAFTMLNKIIFTPIFNFLQLMANVLFKSFHKIKKYIKFDTFLNKKIKK